MNDRRPYGPLDEPAEPEGDGLFLAVNLRLSPDHLPPGIVADSENQRMSAGTVAPRLGVVKPGWLNVTAALVDNGIRPVETHHGAGVFKDPDSFEWVLLAADGLIYRCKENNARLALGLPTGVQIRSAVTFCQAFNKVYCFRGRYLAPLVLASVNAAWADIVPHFDATDTYMAAVVLTGQVAEEIAYGPFQAVTSITSAGDIATVTTTSAHGYVTGADITIQGATQTEYNGRFNITVTDDDQFTYQFTGSATTPATGTIKCANMSRYYRALGSRVQLTSITRVAQVATATKNAHGFSNGQYVTVAGATEVGYNITAVISNVTANTFDYTVAGAPATPATGSPIYATTSLVLAGQSPDTNPEAWQRIYDVLPNADNALFINNRLLVPTAYTPGVDGYDSTASTYTKKDFLVATSIQDEVHFDFVDEFRINQGSDDEIVDLVKYDNDTVLVFKEKSWGILSNIRIDLANVQLDMRGQRYGLCARGAVVVAGKDVYFMATQRGVVSLNQTEQGLIQSVDTPFSNDIEPWIRRINWSFKEMIRLTWWDNKLFVSVPMDDCAVSRTNLSVLTADGSASGLPGLPPLTYYRTSNILYNTHDAFGDINENASILYDATDGYWYIKNFATRMFRSTSVTGPYEYYGVGPHLSVPIPAVTAETQGETGTANAILVHDFRNLARVRGLLGPDAQAWAGRDLGPALCPLEFILTTVRGRERLLFTAADGFVNLYEQSTAGDEVADSSRESQLGWEAIATRVQTRGYTHDELMPKRFPWLEIGLSVWNARFTLTAQTGQSRATKTLVTDREFSRTRYLRPFDRQPYDPTNGNDDFAEPHRGNYSLELTEAGFYCGSALTLAKHYDVFARYNLRTLTGGYVQLTLTNDQGRCTLKGVTPMAQSGPRRMGVLV